MKSQNQLPRSADRGTAWAEIVGATIAVLLLLTLGLVAAGGWSWFAAFLVGAAPAWIQALGAIAAIWGAFHLASRQQAEGAAQAAEARRQHRRQRLEVCRCVLQRVASVFGSAKAGLIERNGPYILRRELEDAKRALGSLPLFEVPDSYLVTRMNLAAQSLHHLELALDQVEEHFDFPETARNWADAAKKMEAESSQTISYCVDLIAACSTAQEMVDSLGPEFARSLLKRKN